MRAIVCGNLISTRRGNASAGDASTIAPAAPAAGGLGQGIDVQLAADMREADAIVARLAATMPVDVMPGEHDPGSQYLPQTPIHPCLLPRSNAYCTLNRTANPYAADIGHVLFVGTSGQVERACRPRGGS